jgi:hypothetical protein
MPVPPKQTARVYLLRADRALEGQVVALRSAMAKSRMLARPTLQRRSTNCYLRQVTYFNGTEKLSMTVKGSVSLGEPRTSTEILVGVTDSLTC